MIGSAGDVPRRHGAAVSEVAIVGAGIAGLTLALRLHDVGIHASIYEASPSIEALGVGINLLPHGTKVLAELGLEADLARIAITTANAVFYNRFGQLAFSELLGRSAGYDHPQFSIHRGDLQRILLDAVEERVGSIYLDHRVSQVEQDERGVTIHFDQSTRSTPSARADVVIGCDGVHSTLRRQLHPTEGEPRYSGVNMWRGVTRWPRVLDGASMIRAGWITTGKMVIYPIRDLTPGGDLQLVNWVAEVESAQYRRRDWTRPGRLGDFIERFAQWQFEWLDLPAFLEASEMVLEYPMVDQDPLERWSFGRVTLLGDAAHPMVPRGSNGAGQAILDTVCLVDALIDVADPVDALKRYEAIRLPATSRVVVMNRTNPPDAILREVFERTGDKPFDSIEDVISHEEMSAISERYRRAAGFSLEQLR